MFLYFSVINDKLIKFTINELEVNITKINIVVNFFPIIKKDGNRKNIKIYQTGVSMKKFVFIAFASTVAASSAAKKSPMENINNSILPSAFERPKVKSYIISLS